ncbi:MAG: kelch repeat-containing protein [Myxococcota bacterium]
MRAGICAVLVLAACTTDGGGSATTSSSTSGGAVASSSSSSGGDEGGWVPRADMANGPRQETAVAALGGEIYVVGGFDEANAVVADVEAYDPATDTWRTIAPLPEPLHHCNAAAVDGRLYVVGCLGGGNFGATGITLEYDPAANMWTTRAPMPAGTERGSSAVGVVRSKVYVAGGLRGSSVTDFSSYDTATNTWEILPPMPVPRDHLVGGAVGDTFYALGGRSPLTARVDAFSTSTGQWSERASGPTARAGTAAAVLDGVIYVFGGEGNSADPLGIFNDTEAYDPATDSWRVLRVMRTPRHGTGAAAVGSAIYVPGGATVQGFGAVATMEMFVP